MNIRVLNDGKEVYTGPATQFLEDNEYDEVTVEMIDELKEKSMVDRALFHSGNWVIEIQ